MGDCTDANLLREEAVERADVFCVLTDDDESNILSALQAKSMGARKVIAIISNSKMAHFHYTSIFLYITSYLSLFITSFSNLGPLRLIFKVFPNH